MTTEHTIRIAPQGRDINAADGSNLLSTLAEHSILLRSDCGGKGTCGKCLVNVSADSAGAGTLKACQTEITRNLSISIPESSLLSAHIVKKAPVTLPVSFLQTFTGDKSKTPSYGVAIDLGTTTLALYLSDIRSGSIVSSLALKNPQAIHGDDVMSRIGFAGKSKNSVHQLQQLVVKAVEWGCSELLRESNLGFESIKRMVAVGNPAMIHLFLGVDPQSIGKAPYQPAFTERRSTSSASLGFTELNVTVETLPQISGFIGGDTIAAVIAADLLSQPPGTLLVDIGTNGELVYKGEHGLYATSCATGPAFEGASLSCGIQAIPEAIDKVIISSPQELPQYRLIQAGETVRSNHPAGLCGSGVVSAAAALCRTGIVEHSGAFTDAPDIVGLQKDGSGSRLYEIAPQGKKYQDQAVVLRQKDIRSIQLGKAALITGIEFLLQQEGDALPEKVIIAGAFGSYLDPADMQALGMLPVVDPKKIEVGGNLAGAGAIMALCDSNYIDMATRLSSAVEVVELATSADFQSAFVDNLHFPQPGA